MKAKLDCRFIFNHIICFAQQKVGLALDHIINLDKITNHLNMYLKFNILMLYFLQKSFPFFRVKFFTCPSCDCFVLFMLFPLGILNTVLEP